MSSPAGPLHQSKVGQWLATVTHNDSSCHQLRANQRYLVIYAWLFVPVIVAFLVARKNPTDRQELQIPEFQQFCMQLLLEGRKSSAAQKSPEVRPLW